MTGDFSSGIAPMGMYKSTSRLLIDRFPPLLLNIAAAKFSGANVDIESVKRSMFERFTNHECYLKSVPIIHSSVSFPYDKNDINLSDRQLFPCSSNIAFSQSDKKVILSSI